MNEQDKDFAPDDLEACCDSALIRRITTSKQCVLNGYPAGDPLVLTPDTNRSNR